MLRGYYTAASGLLTRQREIDVIGNNLVNINTPGYKTEKMLTGSFEQELALRVEGENKEVIGNMYSTSAIVSSVETQDSGGIIKSTGRAMDVAIEGPGYYVVQGANGQDYFTREGQFSIDEEGYLIIQNIGRVQNAQGDIFVGLSDFTIENNGDIYGVAGNQIGNLSVAVLNLDSTLEKSENGMYTLTEGGFAYNNGNTKLFQGNLEMSNVDANYEMTSLISAQAGFTSCSTVLQILDEINSRAVTKLGSI